MSDEHREHLKTLTEFGCYKKYIDEHLAGDFAFELSKLLKAKDAEIADLVTENNALKETISDNTNGFPADWLTGILNAVTKGRDKKITRSKDHINSLLAFTDVAMPYVTHDTAKSELNSELDIIKKEIKLNE